MSDKIDLSGVPSDDLHSELTLRAEFAFGTPDEDYPLFVAMRVLDELQHQQQTEPKLTSRADGRNRLYDAADNIILRAARANDIRRDRKGALELAALAMRFLIEVKETE